MSLAAYGAGSLLMAPLANLLLSARLARGKEDRERLCERRGYATHARPAGPLIWLHGASVGEIVSLFSLIEVLTARYPEINILLTSGTVTSARLAETRAPARTLHQFVPVDIPAYVNRFLDHWRPDLALFVESELWPNTIATLKRRRIASVLLNARMSARSARRWRYAPATIRWLLSSFDLCLAQTEADAERIRALGAPHVRVTGNLKFDAAAPPVDEASLAMLAKAIGGRTILVAASTHPGEEAMLAEAHVRIARGVPDLLTIIAPRHPERGGAICEEMAARGLVPRQRSKGDLPEAACDIYVADTLGELGLFYGIGNVVFMGGSLVAHGGQNPIEPAKMGTAILHGPHVFNFAEVYELLDRAGGARMVASPVELPAAVSELLADATLCRDMAARGREAVEETGGALDRTLAALAPLLEFAEG